jgi:hypothetical protein
VRDAETRTISEDREGEDGSEAKDGYADKDAVDAADRRASSRKIADRPLQRVPRTSETPVAAA